MVLKTGKIRCRRGVSLVDTMVAVTILLIAFIGTSSFRYCASLDGRKAKAQTAAARIVLMLCESWRGLNGDVTFDPTELCGPDLNIDTLETNLDKPLDFNLLGSYAVVLDTKDSNNINYYATLSWKDIKPGLRALNVVVAWAQRDMGVDGIQGVDKSFRLTIYTQTF
ncbi:MAG: hypothetical protein A2Z38_02395 [Planctomycetes bacterium RBG_19FT_COMBO_48_8]|nr:MAG: hypothetical protein A2Z38_02395 [Planctomycetes bacterium RBG_19FT_COMBO_48_8]